MNIPTDYYHVNNIRIHNTGREANRSTTDRGWFYVKE